MNSPSPSSSSIAAKVALDNAPTQSATTATLTEEQRNKIAANRKRAEELRKEALQRASGNKGDQHEDASISTKRKRGLQYVDYDLSTLKDSRGGFIPGEFSDERERALRRREDEMAAARARKLHIDDLPFSIAAVDNPHCEHCGSFDLDPEFYSVFHVSVCKKCKNELPDKYSLLTKTEVKEDYLLTDEELRDTEVMPHLLRANPHKASWSNMMLFLRLQVEAFAFKKWNGSEGLDAEWAKREEEKKRKRDEKFKRKLADLRRRTRANEYKKLRVNEVKHAHIYGESEEDTTTGDLVQRCIECGMTITVDEF